MRTLSCFILIFLTGIASASQRVPSQLTVDFGSETGVRTELRAVRGQFYGIVAALDSARGWGLNSGVYAQRTRDFDVGIESLAIYMVDEGQSILGASVFQEGFVPFTYGIVKSRSEVGLMYTTGQGAGYFWKYEITPQVRNIGVPLTLGRSPIARAFEARLGFRYMW